MPDDPDNVIVGTACGVAVSDDAGVTWTHVDPNPATNARRIWDVVAQAGGIVDICGSDGHFRSPDCGQTWVPSTLPTASDVCSIAVSPLESNVIYVTQNNVALWESRDGGANWTMLEDGPGNRRAFVVTNQTGANSFDLYYGAGPKLRYVSGCDDSTVPTRCPAAANLTDGPTLGTDITGDAHDDMGDLEFDPTDATPQCPYLLATDGGVYRSDDCAPTWVRAMVGLHDTWLYDFAGAPLAGNQTGLYFGLMDSGLWYSTDGGSTLGRPDVLRHLGRRRRRGPGGLHAVLPDHGAEPGTGGRPVQHLADDAPFVNPPPPPSGGWLQWFQQTDSIQTFATGQLRLRHADQGQRRSSRWPAGTAPAGSGSPRTSARATRSSAPRRARPTPARSRWRSRSATRPSTCSPTTT